MRVEEKIQIDLFSYLALQYPHVMAISEASGVRVSKGLAVKLKKMRSRHTHADIYVLCPKGKWHGLVIELKAKNIYKKDGTLYKDEHLEDQQKTIDALNKLGYYATFAVGFDQAKSIVDNYLNGNI
jgi:hypothetical protein